MIIVRGCQCCFSALSGVCLSASHVQSHSGRYTAGHVCSRANGFEPNYEDWPECSTYWRCRDHVATLERCHGSDQFHFQYGVCMNDDDVSCWAQMEKYHHGLSYSEHVEFPTTKTCDIAKGQEPNYYDEGCKSYWYCEAHQGTLHECPEGFQFHWGKLDCAWDQEVYCEKQMEFFYENFLYEKLHPGGEHLNTNMQDMTTPFAEHNSEVSAGSPGSRPPRSSCDVERGLVPDYGSRRCQTFWQCVGYLGTLKRCPDGYLFHWEERGCVHEAYVDCVRQRESFAAGVNP
ncbi:uncharacterized protein LOC143302026 [Babylonia areolata]|uniref:uncharacterized protein LOC143302026 n=1 Tax=Babylonia areolata TaxID=304850 RepID=UPI003FCFFB89